MKRDRKSVKVRKSTQPSALIAKAEKNSMSNTRWTWCARMDCKCFHPCNCQELCGPRPSRVVANAINRPPLHPPHVDKARRALPEVEAQQTRKLGDEE